MNKAEFEVLLDRFCREASEPAFCVLLRTMINLSLGADDIDRSMDSYRQRFGHPFTQKELTPAATDVSR